MLNSAKYIFAFSLFTILLCSALNAMDACKTHRGPSIKKNKTHIVVAMPFRPNMPLDPHWYTEEYVSYIANLLPSKDYTVTGYWVSLVNIPQFLEDMEALYVKEKNVRVLNFCDGGEWDGYPGISVTTQWEKHRVSRLIPFSGADSSFIFNSDNKILMNSHIAKANLKSLPQGLVPAQKLSKTDLEALLTKEHLDQAWPLFCKLNIGAGALGIDASSICNNFEELLAQLNKMHALYPTSDILVQPYLVGPEYTILVLKDRVYAGVRRDFLNPYNLMLEDYLTGVRPVDDEIRYYPAPEHVQNLAIKAIQAIPGEHHYTRVDLRDDAHGNTYVLDINDRPGFGGTSTVKCMLDFHHLSEAQLLLDIVKTMDVRIQKSASRM